MPQVTPVDAPNSTSLLELLSVKAELGISGTGLDTEITAMIARATSEVYARIGRPAYRTQWLEKTNGPPVDRNRLMLSRTPVKALSQVVYKDQTQTLSEFEIADGDAGFLYTQAGFFRSTDPLAWEVTYTAGYFLPGDDFSGAVDVDGTDDSFNSSAAFPKYIVAGDWINASGFTNDENNGLHQVVTATTSKITVATSLTTEGSATRAIAFETVPGALKTAALELVKGMYFGRQRDAGVTSEKVGPISTSYGLQTSRAVDTLLSPFMAP